MPEEVTTFSFSESADRGRQADPPRARAVWSPTPTGPMKEHIIDLCNRELARRRHTPVEAETSTSASRKKNRDAPLVRGYNFLRSSSPALFLLTHANLEPRYHSTSTERLALSYQLESLHQQALQLANTSWSASLKIEMNKERTELRLGYWWYVLALLPSRSACPFDQS